MMGGVVRDPHGVESCIKVIPGLGLLDMETEMYPEKTTSQVEAGLICQSLPFPCSIEVLAGYEIHMGRSVSSGMARPLFRISRRDGKSADIRDGLSRPDGSAWGTYIHGIFDNDGFRNGFLEYVANRSGKVACAISDNFSFGVWKEEQYERLAEFVGRHVDVDRILKEVIG